MKHDETVTTNDELFNYVNSTPIANITRELRTLRAENERLLNESASFKKMAITKIDALRAENEQLRVENSRLAGLLLDEKSQLEIATDLGNKRWIALNDIYENGEKHNANWCKRRAGEAIGGNNG